jgi:DNA invertase Pin-like site-specific DNA recombinase
MTHSAGDQFSRLLVSRKAVPEREVATMAKTYGYARVSTDDQDLGLQITALREAGVPVRNIYKDTASGKAGSKRPEFEDLMARIQPGDKLVVWKVDRLSRSVPQLLTVMKELTDQCIHIHITTLSLDLATPTGKLVFGIIAQIAEFERELIRERVIAGMAEARKRPGHPGLGRRHTLRPHQRAEAVRLHAEGKSLGAIAALFGCSRSVVHRATKAAAA